MREPRRSPFLIATAADESSRGRPPRRQEHLATVRRGNITYLAESEVEGLTSIRYDIVSLLVTGSEKAPLRRHKNGLDDGKCP